jgi:hypothetical protein
MRDDFEPMEVGNDDFEGGVTVQMVTDEDGGRHAAFVPVALGRLGAEGLGMMADLQKVVLQIRESQDRLGALVVEARDLGMSWGSIGWCVGTSEPAARQRWGS